VTDPVLVEPGARPIIGHRGASGLAPENTIASFDLALAQGAEALELDVRLTADGVPVVHHDPTLERTTSGAGPLATRRWGELARLDAGARFSPDGRTHPFRDRGIRIPAFREILTRYAETPLLVELKTADAQAAVRDELVRAGAAGRVVLASFLDEALDAFRRPPFLVGASRRDILDLKLRSLVGLPARDRGVRAYAVPDRYKDRIPVPTPAFLRAAARIGRPVHVWTVNDPERASRLWSLGAAGMITNYPGLIRAARDRGPHRPVGPDR
jgi:glycerophosphoryl diester phosphodiesterase